MLHLLVANCVRLLFGTGQVAYSWFFKVHHLQTAVSAHRVNDWSTEASKRGRDLFLLQKCRKTKTKIACFPDQSENWQMGHSQTFTSACSVVSKGLSDGIEPVWMKILPKLIFQLESSILTLNTQPRWVSALAPTQKREFIVKSWRSGATSSTMKSGQKSNSWWSLGGNVCVT